MRAAVFHLPKKITCDSVPDPKLVEPTDVILRVTKTAICGSDLHIYNGLFPQVKSLVMGHEFMGEVIETGKQVSKLKTGDRVVVPFTIACGTCYFCSQGLTVHCERSNPKNYGPDGGLLKGKGGGLFGYTELYGGYAGGQAEYVRVPYADVGPRLVPEQLSDEAVLFLSDILPTGYTAIKWANLQGGEVVAVFGCGPVGLMAQKCAWFCGAKRVFGLDVEPYRLESARITANAEPVDVSKDGWLDVLRDATQGRGPDVTVDAVGMEAHHGFLSKLKNLVHLELGSLNGFRMCVDAVRRGGVVSVVGVYGMAYDNFPLGQLFDKGVRLAMGQAPVHAVIDELLEAIGNGKLKADDVISHHLPLSDVSTAYDIFNTKRDGCVKVVLSP
jgi:S-(hydroxymethyl)glutathione dehydrogenase / alcohol dehydrogenase